MQALLMLDGGSYFPGLKLKGNGITGGNRGDTLPIDGIARLGGGAVGRADEPGINVQGIAVQNRGFAAFFRDGMVDGDKILLQKY